MADQPRRGRLWTPAEAGADQLRRRIVSGEVPESGLLPRSDDLRAEFGRQPAVRSACAILETDGGQPTDAPATGAVRAELVRDSLSGWPGGWA